VVALPDGAIAVADTYSQLRIWRDGRLETLATSEALDEPGGLDILPDGRLVVADTNAPTEWCSSTAAPARSRSCA
jgi:hypothetical protein